MSKLQTVFAVMAGVVFALPARAESNLVVPTWGDDDQCDITMQFYADQTFAGYDAAFDDKYSGKRRMDSKHLYLDFDEGGAAEGALSNGLLAITFKSQGRDNYTCGFRPELD